VLQTAHAYTLKTLYSFCSADACQDGKHPYASLLMDAAGNLYGVAAEGGDAGFGAAFELSPPALGKMKWKYRRLYSFCAEPNCPDGAGPDTTLIMDVAGNLYGTTPTGGAYGSGQIFELLPRGKGWIHRDLHDFGGRRNDGRSPQGGLSYVNQESALYDGVSPLYGTAFFGGANGGGVAYRLTKDNRRWKRKTLYSFCAMGSCSDGYRPNGVILDNVGNIFGTTWYGGSDYGVLFEISAESGQRTETVLCDFSVDCKGSVPHGRLLIDGDGALIGVTNTGGATDHGTVFKYSPADGGFTDLYDFCPQADCGADGQYPNDGVTSDSDGNLYGTTFFGGTNNKGTIFRLAPGDPYQETVLYSFCTLKNCEDGESIWSGVIVDASGNLFGTTRWGGAHGQGSIYALTP